MRTIGSAVDGDSRQAFLQGLQTLPFHENDHLGGYLGLAASPPSSYRIGRSGTRRCEVSAREDAGIERLNSNHTLAEVFCRLNEAEIQPNNHDIDRIDSSSSATEFHSDSQSLLPPRSQRLARPKVAVDIVLFAAENGRLKCYLVQLKRGTLKSKWAFPGGLVKVGEVLDAAARRELASTTGLDDAYLEQLFTFGDPSRDPRAHVVSVAYMALISDSAEV